MQKVRRLFAATVLIVAVTQMPVAALASTPDPAPEAPTTSDGGASSNVWLFIALGLGAVAFGIGGATVARRNR